MASTATIPIDPSLTIINPEHVHRDRVSNENDTDTDDTNPIPLFFRTMLHYESQYRAIICLLCSRAISRKSLNLHLLNNHQIDHRDRVPLVDALRNNGRLDPLKLKDIALPPNNQPPIIGLAIFVGYSCTDCDLMKTKSYELIRRHHNSKHPNVS